jgi:hypothetical protein
MDVGVWISGCVSGFGLAVIVWTVFYLFIDTLSESERRCPDEDSR